MGHLRFSRGLAPSLLVLASLMGCAADGCGPAPGGSDYEYPEPPPAAGEIHPEVITARVQQTFLDFVTSHLSDAIRTFYPTRTKAGIERAVVYLPEQGFDIAVAEVLLRDGCIGDGSDPSDCAPTKATKQSAIELNLDTIDESFDARFVAGTADVVEVEITDLDVFFDMAMYADNFLLSDGTCHVHDDEDDKPAVRIKKIEFDVELLVDEAGELAFDIGPISIDVGDFSDESVNVSVDPCNSSECLDPECTPASDTSLCSGFTNSCSWLSGFVETGEFLTTLLGPLLEETLPPIFDQLFDQFESAGGTVALRVEQQVDLATASGQENELAEVVFANATALNLAIHPGEDVFQMDGAGETLGMSTVLDSGAFAEHSPCVPTVSLPDFDAGFQPPSPFDGRIEVAGADERYDLGFAISEVMTRQIGHALHEMGALCVTLPSNQLGELSGDALSLETLSLIAPELGEVGDSGSPLIFQLHPTVAPDIYFGTGATIGTNGDGEPVTDSLVSVDLGELGLSIYAKVDGDYRRLATISGDVFVGLDLERTSENTLSLTLERIRFANVVEVYNELAADANFAEVVEVLVDLALETVLGSFSTFEFDIGQMVSDALGAPVYARINTIERQGGDPGFLGVYVRMCGVEDLSDPAEGPCYTPPQTNDYSSVRWLGGGERLVQRAHASGRSRTPVLFEVGEAEKVLYRVDGGLWWRGHLDAGVLHADAPRLLTPGHHRVEIRRARSAARGATFGPASSFDVTIR